MQAAIWWVMKLKKRLLKNKKVKFITTGYSRETNNFVQNFSLKLNGKVTKQLC